VTATAREYVGAAAPVTTGVPLAQVAAFAVMTAALVAAPFFAYPVFLMKALCFALFACAFNLLIGYVGLLSFGHAVFLGTAGYAAAHSAKVWGFRPELAILFGTAVAAVLGIVIGALAIRSKGIYFANITLALAQMVYFFCLQAAFTGGEDGIQSVPRGTLLGFLDLRDTLTLYFVVLAVFLAGFLLIYRAIHSPLASLANSALSRPRAACVSRSSTTALCRRLAYLRRNTSRLVSRSTASRSTSRPSRSSKESPSTLRCRRCSSSALAMPVSPSASSRS